MARHPRSPETAFPVTRAAPHVRGFWTLDRVTLAVIAALAPPFILAVSRHGLAPLIHLVVGLAAAMGWQAVFAAARGTRLTPSGAVTALTVAALLPAEAPLWQVALAVSFGTVIGEQIFGGYGRNFVNAAALSLAFLMFSFPDGGFDKAMAPGWAAPLAGGILLVALGIVSWRTVVGGFLGALAIALIAGTGAPLTGLLAGGLTFGLVYLAGDPVAAPATNGGRWLYGLGVGALAALGGADGPASVRAVVFACLIGSIFAPLIDQAAIWIHANLRRRRIGRG